MTAEPFPPTPLVWRVEIGIDCHDAHRLAEFWAAALGSPGYHGAGGPYVELDAAPGLPTIYFQRVPEGKVVKNRVHLDLFFPDADEAIDRLAALGASPLGARVHGEGSWWQVMADPEGNEFCVCEDPPADG